MNFIYKTAFLFLIVVVSACGENSGSYPDQGTGIISGKIFFSPDLRSEEETLKKTSANKTTGIPVNAVFVPGEILIRFKNTSCKNQLNRIPGLLLHKQLSGCNYIYKIENPKISKQSLHSAMLEWVEQLNKRTDILSAAPVYLRPPLSISISPDDTYFPDQWNLKAVHLPEAWGLALGSEEIVIAVIDNGIAPNRDLYGENASSDDSLTNPGSESRCVKGFDFISDLQSAGDGDGPDDNPFDSQEDWHGTHVSGIMCALTDNNEGIAGVTWEGRIMPLRVIGKYGASDDDIAQAILYAAGLPNSSGKLPEKKASVINMSFGGPGIVSEPLLNAISDARASGCVLVAAAGNSNSDVPIYPAACEGVISVAAVNEKNEKTQTSSFGMTIDLAAPGGDRAFPVWSTLFPGYGTLTGTSVAAPHVSGIIALMFGIHPDLTPDDINLLFNGRHPDLPGMTITDDLGEPEKDFFYGHGLINACKAVIAARNLKNGEKIAVMLVDPDDNTRIISRTVTDKNKDFCFEFKNIPLGDYMLFAGTNRFGTGVFTGPDDMGAFYKDEDNSQIIRLLENEILSNINLILEKR